VPPELGCWGPDGDAPPVFGSTPPPLPLLGVPDDGVPCCEDGGVPVPLEGVGVPPDGDPVLGVPPPDPPIGVPPLEPLFAFLFFFLSPGCTGSPVVTGGTTGCTVWLEPDEPPPPPPLDATAITTMRKNAATATATSRRRR
jgi:hypothetical protein